MSAYLETPFRLRSATLDPAFMGGPGDLLSEFVRLTEIVSPSGFYGIVVSDTEPSSNIGLWLRGGTKPYVWDENQNRYVPIDLSDSLVSVLAAIAALQAVDVTHNTQIAALQAADTVLQGRAAALEALFAKGRIVFSNTEPAATDRDKVLWVKTNVAGTLVEALKNWNSTTLVWSTIIEFPIKTFTEEFVFPSGDFDMDPFTGTQDFDITVPLPAGKTWKNLEIRLVGKLSFSSIGNATGTLRWNTGGVTSTLGISDTEGFGTVTQEVTAPPMGSSAFGVDLGWVGIVPESIKATNITIRLTWTVFNAMRIQSSRYQIIARATSE
jgi:hypothetical protein